MSEENIIKYDFGNNPKKEQPVSDEEETEGEIIQHDFNSKRKNSNTESDSFEDTLRSVFGAEEDYHRGVEKGFSLLDIMGKISHLRPSQSSIIQGDSIVKDYTIQEITGWLERATDHDITQKPGFYFALMKRYKRLRRMI